MGTDMTIDKALRAEIAVARRRGRIAMRTEPRAAAARYDAATRSLVVELTHGVRLSVPVALLPWLAQATDDQLAEVEVGPVGIGLSWPSLDVDLEVAGLVRYVFGRQAIARAAGAHAGSVRSEAKAEAARRNGAKGGRPRKTGAKKKGTKRTKRSA